MLKLLVFLLLFILAVPIIPVHATVNTGTSAMIQSSNAVKVEVSDIQKQTTSTPDPSPVLKTENSNFEAKGIITSISGDNFDVEGITVTKSPNHLTSVSGNIEIGKRVEVKGVLENGLRYAKEIKMEGSATPAPSVAPKISSTSPASQPASQPQSKPDENNKPTVSEIKSNPPLSKPPATITPGIVTGNQNLSLPSPSQLSQPEETPKPESSYFFKPVVTFFENLFKDWF